ncbi:hypothetical protein F7725_020171 [Dissostichus mawsoni]|uniref:Solute carrier family 35 member F2 n=1 Tax=Dissostichus mawsoni TaxID=36200 RepID=A0A7J5YDD1_DISMA|nr:hypothetical protein F7725_020171 [Dissostichus mawsoni]
MATDQSEDVYKDLSSGSKAVASWRGSGRSAQGGLHLSITWSPLSLRQLARTLAMGQGLAGLICGTAISSQYLASSFHVNTPMMQSFMHYTLLCLTYTTMLLCRTGDGNILQILRKRWWKYLLLGLVDVEANYAVVKAYQYTTLTSVQVAAGLLRDPCPDVPVLVGFKGSLQAGPLRHRLHLSHWGGGAMVGADLLAGRDQGSTSNILLGDGLVLISASLYAVSNVCQEYTVKNLSRVEFLGMVGLFGTIISTIQICAPPSGLLFAAYALCMYTLYSCMPIVVKLSSATSVNLSLLTADLFSLFCGVFLFQYSLKTEIVLMYPYFAPVITSLYKPPSSPPQFSGLYLVSLVIILIGFITFNAVPTPTDHTDPATASFPVCEDGYYSYPVAYQNDIIKQEVAVRISTEGEGETEEWRNDKEKRRSGRFKEDVGLSTKM